MREIDKQTTSIQSTRIRLGDFLHKKHNSDSTHNAKMFFFGILIYDLDFCNKLNKTCGFLPYHRACVVLSERLLIRAAEKSDSSIACF